MKWLKQKLGAFWEWMYWREDGDVRFNWTDGNEIPGDSRAKSYALFVILALLIIPFIFFVIWLDSLFK